MQRTTATNLAASAIGCAPARTQQQPNFAASAPSSMQQLCRSVLLALALLAPARCGSPWPAAPRARARALLAQLTLDEKVALLSGMNAGYGTAQAVSPYVGWTAGVPRLGIPPLAYEDGPQGVADGLLGVTQWPSVGTVAQSWDADLFLRWGAAMGAEQRGKGSSIMLGPAVTVSRVPWSGRIFEYPGEDPFHSSALMAPYVTGVQSNNVSACAKHAFFNHQELHRGDARGSPGMSSNVPQRAARELYLPPYAAAIDAGVGAVMCAFVRVNNTQACESPALLRDWLQDFYGFDGLTVSDWTATHSTVASALAGLTVEQEWLLNATYFGANLTAAVRAGSVPLATLDAMALRVLTTVAATTDLLDAPRAPGANVTARVTSPAHAALARELAVAGTVLLRNAPLCLTPAPNPYCTPLLPLDASTLCRVAIIGDPGDTVAGFGSGGVAAPYAVTPAAGLAAALGPRTTLIVLSGANASEATAAAASADVALVLVGERTGEGMDRAGLLALPAGQDALVAAVAAAQQRTVVVARCSGPCLMPWRDSVLAIVSQYYAGQEAGNALADVLLGAASPAGRLALTWPASSEDTWLSGGGAGGGAVDPEQYPGTDRGRGYPEVDYKEGLAVGYRWADLYGKEPLWPFGHGLSYTAFNYSDLLITGAVSAASNATLSFTLRNAGAVAGAEVWQVYVAGALPGDPPWALQGFGRTSVLAAGQALGVTLALTPAQLRLWSVEAGAFAQYPSGMYAVRVGASSRDVRLAGSVRVV